MIVYVKRFPIKNVLGVAIFPFIFVKDYFKGTRGETVLINHEKIHIRQQVELGVIPFYILYLWYWMWLRITLGKKGFDYSLIPFEKEAYVNQYDLNYLNKRKPYSWINY